MDPTILSAIIAASAGLTGVLIGGLITWLITRTTQEIQKQLAAENARAQRRAGIEAMILKLSEFAIQYPLLEKDEVCGAYPDMKGDDRCRERYENYCCYVFNTLGAVWDFCEGDRQKIGEFTSAKELVRRHYKCWLADRDNLSYPEKYRQFVQSIIDDLRKRGEIK